MSCALRVVMGGHCVAFIVLRICKSFGIYSSVMKKIDAKHSYGSQVTIV